ncbi:MAG: hypothetical protein H3C47_02225 [Candidatus Cloacimonetes bacterium]|nr:hypothetical protein [Candidatus Cloacimonadota bacterium]
MRLYFDYAGQRSTAPTLLLDMVKELFSQHTRESGQDLESGLVEEVYRLSCGQPWLCNALGEQMCFKLFPKERILRQEHLKAAKEALILARTTHPVKLRYTGAVRL